MNNANTRKAIGYIRVSTGKQAAEGVSLDAQRTRIEAWAAMTGHSLQCVYRDAQTGKRADNRAGLQRALAHAKAEGAALVVYSLSRLSRSVRDTLDIAEALQTAGAALVSLSEALDGTTAAGKMVMGVLAVLAQFERDQISERTASALAYKRAEGFRVGSVPYGFAEAEGGRLVPCEAEAAIVQRAKALRADGIAYRAIALTLEAEGFKARNGRAFHPQQIKSMVA